MTLRTFDLAPLYRATVGFDQIADLMDRALTQDAGPTTIPPTTSRSSPTAPGASRSPWPASLDELPRVRENALIVTPARATDSGERKFLHRGIATRAFERRFHLADHVRVTGASHVDGMLHIDLVREVPEALKPRRIEIAAAAAQDANLVEAKAVN
jgi:molecular chaperone IbpA